MSIFAGKKKSIIIAALLVLLAITISACSSDEIVAKVGDDKITKDELYNVLVKDGGEQALNNLIAEKILAAEAKKEGVSPSDEDIQAELAKLKEESGGDEAFQQMLMMYGLTEEELIDNIRLNLMIEGLVGPLITLEDADIEDYYLENKADYTEDEQVRARHILVKTEELAAEIEEKLANGEDFEELAKEYSEDPGSATQGGDLGFFGKGEMVKEFEEASFSQEIGKVGKAVKSDHGYHIILVEERKEAGDIPLQDVKEEIEAMLFNERVSAKYQEWYDEKYQEYKVDNKLENK